MDYAFKEIIILVVLATIATICATCPHHCSCSKTQNGTDVVCKRTNQTQFPDSLPKDTISLKFTYIDITVLNKGNFTYLTKLQVLTISHCKISSIARDTFNELQQLIRLDLTYNPFNPKDMLWLAACGADKLQKLEFLDVGNTNLGVHQLEILIDCLQHQAHLQDLYLSGNKLLNLPNFIFSKLPNLQQLDISQAKLADPLNVLAFVNMTSLKRLHLELNYLRVFPNFTINGEHRSILPSLEFIELNYNNIISLPRNDVGLKQLLYLTATHNHIGLVDRSLLSSVMPSLKSLTLEANRIETDKLVMTSTKLTILNLSHNKITAFNNTMLHNLPNLRILFLDGNELSAFWIPAIGNAFFKYNKKLVYISMATARIAQLSVEMFWELPQLGKLFLYDNAISFLDPRLFEKSLQLRKLDLRNNRITVISENTFPRQILSNVVMLELGENPYECDCGLIWFSDWMNRTSIHLGQLSHYKCLTPPEQHGKHLIQFRMPPELCQSKAANLAFKLSISLSVSCSVILAVAGVVYKFRWHIGYLCFLLQSKRRKYRAIHDPTDYRYDAFIAYNRADAQWLLNNLVPKLEVECGLKLCIHDRDWPLGLDIYDNIVESISNSRKTILLVSNAFATSEWCHFEMTMAQSRLFEEDRNALIMVVLEDIQPTNITPRLAMQMKRQTFVVWTDNEMGKKLFWKKLHKAVKRPVDSVMFDPN